MIHTDVETYPHDALHIFSERRFVQEHNIMMLNKLDGQQIIVTAITKVPPSVKQLDVTGLVSGLPHQIHLAKNARVMLIRNCIAADGLVNGGTGTILDILQSSQTEHMPKAIIVRFDNDQIGSLSRQSSTIPLHQYDVGTPIFPKEAKHAGKSLTSPEVTRIQIPLILSWSITIHKVQGATLKQVVISL